MPKIKSMENYFKQDLLAKATAHTRVRWEQNFQRLHRKCVPRKKTFSKTGGRGGGSNVSMIPAGSKELVLDILYSSKQKEFASFSQITYNPTSPHSTVRYNDEKFRPPCSVFAGGHSQKEKTHQPSETKLTQFSLSYIGLESDQ